MEIRTMAISTIINKKYTFYIGEIKFDLKGTTFSDSILIY